MAKEYAKCSKCGHDRFTYDNFAAIPSVKRVLEGNAICAKCGEPAPVKVGRDD